MTRQIGAIYQDNKCNFTVWAPEKSSLTLHITHPKEQTISMRKDEDGYFTTEVQNIKPGCRYYYMPDGEKDYPDPASCYQPEGVHKASEVFDHSHTWSDKEWKGIPLEDYIICEIHIGTFTEEGAFDAAIARLDDLADTGINAVEIMPAAQFPGRRNWGYDGVYPYAVQNSYGGPAALKRFVDACHNKGIAVILDVVYNHIGPEGNYLGIFAPYFTHKYGTPWGQAINYDGPWSDGVRNYFCNNALYWFHQFHIDALRLDAIHEMYDFGAVHFWEFLHDAVKREEQQAGKHYYLIAESDLNNPKIVKHPEAGGYGFNAQWLDDFHHALYTTIYKKGRVRYKDFGRIEQLAKAYTDGFVHSGDYVMFRKKKYGKSSAGLPGNRFIIFNQNHDQIGNQADCARLSTQISFNMLKVAAAAQLLAPYIPMLFMGEDYGEDAPFNYFIDHSDAELIKAVRKGRKKEFEGAWDTEPADPQDEKTFLGSKLQWEKRDEEKGKMLRNWYKELLSLRKTNPALKTFNKNNIRVHIWHPDGLTLHRKSEDEQSHIMAVFNFSAERISYTPLHEFENWAKILDSGDFSQNINFEQIPARISAQSMNIPPESVAVFANVIVNEA